MAVVHAPALPDDVSAESDPLLPVPPDRTSLAAALIGKIA